MSAIDNPSETASSAPTAAGRRPLLADMIRNTLGVRPGEEARTAMFAGYLVVVSAIFIGGRATRDTLFLSHHGIDRLPWIFIAYAVVSTILAAYYGKLVNRVQRVHLVVGTCALGALSYVLAWVAIRAQAGWIYSTFYIWAEVVGSLFVSQFWAFANDYHSTRDAKRLFGLIGAGRVLGIVACGVGISCLARQLGTENLPLVLAALMGCAAGIALAIRRRFGVLATHSAAPSSTLGLSKPPEEPVLASAYSKYLAGVVFCTFLVCQLADYQFKAIARATYQGDALASYFGTLYAVLGSVAFVIQFFFTSRILARFGVLVGLLAMPLALAFSSAGLLLWPGILAASALKFSDNTFQYSINEAATQLLYFPFPAALKGRVRALIDGSVNPSAFGLAGLVLLAVSGGVPVERLSLLTLPILAGWIWLAVPLCREYVGALSKTLRDRRLRQGRELEEMSDLHARRSLLALLDDPDPEAALFALEQLRKNFPGALAEELERVLASPHAKVHEAAFAALEELPGAGQLERVAQAMEGHPSLDARAAALRAYCAIRGEEAIDAVLPSLTEGKSTVRTAAIVGLLKHCGLDGVLAAGPELQKLLGSANATDRKLAARIFGRIGVRHFFRQVQALLSDPVPEVRKEAARACRAIPNPKLVPALVKLLPDPAAAGSAEKALAQFADGAVPALDEVLAQPDAGRELGKAAVRILRRIATQKSLSTLVEHMDHPDDRLRRKLLRAVASVHEELGRPPVLSAAQMQRRLLDELRRAFQILQDREIVQTAYPGWLLVDTFDNDLTRSTDRLWSLLSLSYQPEVVGACKRSIAVGNPTQRSNALEVLDNLVVEPVKGPLLALLEPHSSRETVAIGRRHFPLVTLTPLTWLVQHFKGGGGWHRAVALDCVGLHRVHPLARHVEGALDDPVPLVRETALWAAFRLHGPRVYERPAASSGAPTRWMAQAAARHLGTLESTGGRTVLTTLEEVVFMRHIPLFRGVAAEHLAALAELTAEVYAAAGDEIVRQGEPCDRMFLIVSGRVEVLVDGRRVGELGPRDCFGEMALIDGETRSATVRALEPSDLLSLGHDEFHEFLEERSEVASNVLKILCQRIRALNQRLVGDELPAPVRSPGGGG
ncbi:MAG: cyclic nucleotide-binding domain-containing protein [Candidatus Wallbacteria bacterium]|nr:cyclic nucleotide-binding domain-containing protein [Candidatus Wallbacteria bacterium]